MVRAQKRSPVGTENQGCRRSNSCYRVDVERRQSDVVARCPCTSAVSRLEGPRAERACEEILRIVRIAGDVIRSDAVGNRGERSKRGTVIRRFVNAEDVRRQNRRRGSRADRDIVNVA